MARPRQIADNSSPQEAFDAEFDDVSAITADTDSTEADIAAEFGSATHDVQFHFHVKKHVKGSKTLEYCFQGTQADLPVNDRIQQQYGGGTYEIWLFKKEGDKPARLHRKFTIGVAEPKVQVIPPNANNDALLQLVRQQGEQLQRLSERAVAPTSFNFSPEMITAVTGAVTALAAVLKPAAPQTSMADMLGILATAKELVGGDNGGSDDSLLGLAKTALTNPGLMEAIAAMGRGSAAQPVNLTHAQPNALTAPTQPQNLGAPQPRPAAPQAPQAPTPEMLLKQELARLTKCAARNSDPALWADVLVDEYPADFIQQVQMPGALDYLQSLHPPMQQYRAWFEELVSELANVNQDGVEETKLSPAGVTIVPSYTPTPANAASDPGRVAGYGDDAASNEGEGSGE